MDILSELERYSVKVIEITNSTHSSIEIPAYVINLDEDNYRRGYMKYMLKLLNINYKLIIVQRVNDAICKKNPKMRKGVIGCSLSHLWCIRDAIKCKHKNFLILEDDIVFHKNFLGLFRQTNYNKYDLLQLGCCDFCLHTNIKNKYTPNVYRPTKNALGAYGNIYNLNFAKVFFNDKVNNFSEFDISMQTFYDRFKIGVCYPYLVSSELSTTNLDHKFSIFDKQSLRFTKCCFLEYKPDDYYFVWIVFLKYCYEEYKNMTFKKALNYNTLIQEFAERHKGLQDKISQVLQNNGLKIKDVYEILDNYKEERI